MRRLKAFLVASLALLCCAGGAAAAGPADQGQALFGKDCAACHTIGGGNKVGPDLQGVIERWGLALVRSFIAAPDKVIASGDPKVTALVTKFHGIKMPNFHLASDQVDALVAYLQSPGSAGGATGGTAPLPAGNASAGKKLYTGATQLAHGGSACISCHTIAGVGVFGGGRIGRDLTKAYSKWGGAQGIASLLAAPPFPQMVPLYAGHPLTRQEQADLAAFFATTIDKPRPSDKSWLLVVLGVGGATCGLGLAFLVWPRRRQLVVRKRLVPTPTAIRRT